MILVYMFLIHISVWLAYSLHIFYTPYSIGLNKVKLKGSIEEEIQTFLSKYEVFGVTLSPSKRKFPNYDYKNKHIEYNRLSKKRYTSADLYTGFHEAAHALQDKERYWATNIRRIWNLKFKKAFAMGFILSFFYSVLFSLSSDPNWFWNIFIAFLIVHYLYCFIIVIPSEIDAHKKAYVYMINNYDLSDKNKRQLILHSCYCIGDYILIIPLLIFFG